VTAPSSTTCIRTGSPCSTSAGRPAVPQEIIRIRPLRQRIGYFWFQDNWENEYSDTFEDPPLSGRFVTVYDHAEGDTTLAHAPFPFVLAGLTLPGGWNGEIIFEFQYDFEKKDQGFDFSGPIYCSAPAFGSEQRG
jgi:hypothetical protein